MDHVATAGFVLRQLSRRLRRAGSKPGISLLALAVAAGIGVLDPLPVLAQSDGAVRSYTIAAQPLSRALLEFSSASGIQIFFDQGVTAGRNVAGLDGSYSVDGGLSALLSGSGLSYRYTNANTVTVFDPASAPAVGYDGSVILEEVNVTAWVEGAGYGTGFAQSPDTVYETPASVAHVNSQTISSHGNNLNNALRSVAGVSTWENVAQPGLSVNIRGLEGFGRVTSTIDGVRQNYRFVAHAPAGMTYVDPALVAGVDINKGAVTTAGGAGTLAGSVNYRTLNIDDVVPLSQVAGGLVSRTFGGNQQDDVEMLVAGGTRFTLGDYENASSIFGAVNFASAENYSDGAGVVVNNSWRDLRSGLVKLSLVPDATHRLDLGANIYNADFTANFYGQKVRNNTYTLKYAYTPGDDLVDLRVNGYYNNTQSEWTGVTYNGRIIANDAYGLDVTNTSKWTFGDIGLRLDYGAEVYHDSFSTTAATDVNPDAEQTLAGAFVQGTVSAGIFEVIPGLRFDAYNLKGAGDMPPAVTTVYARYDRLFGTTAYTFTRPSNSIYNNPQYVITEIPYDPIWSGPFDVDQTAFVLSPKLTVAAKPVDWLQLYGTYEHSFRPPSPNEMFFGGTHGGGDVASLLPNPSLRPEFARGWEVGANIMADGVLVEGDALRIKAAYYSRDIDDYITTRCDYVNICWFENAPGTSHISGIDIDASYDAGVAFASIAYGRSQSDLQFGDGIGGMGEPSRLPDHVLTATAGVRLLDEDLTLGVRMNDVSKGTLIEGGEWETSAYRTFDLFASYQLSEAVSLFANVTNVTDELYRPALSQDRGPGRRIFLGARLSLTDGMLSSQPGSIMSKLGFTHESAGKADWDGAYLALSAGHAWTRMQEPTHYAPLAAAPNSVVNYKGEFSASSVSADLGYNFALGASPFILGIEAGLSSGGKAQSISNQLWATTRRVNIDANVMWSGAIKGRAGYTVGDFLPYVSAGVAFANFDLNYQFIPSTTLPAVRVSPPDFAGNATLVGYTVGAGIEQAVTDNLAVKVDYSYANFGQHVFTAPQADAAGSSEFGTGLDRHALSVGLSYRF